MQIVDVSKAKAQMLGTKVEIILPKAEPGNWSSLYFPPKESADNKSVDSNKIELPKKAATDDDSDSDLDDIEQVRGVRITDA